MTRSIEHFTKVAPMGSRLTGRWLVSARIGCWYPPAIDPHDVIDVDFDVRTFRDDGLYLLEAEPVGRTHWRGCRRLGLMLDGTLQAEESGNGGWHPIDLAARGWSIVGFVHEVYKPAESKGGAA